MGDTTKEITMPKKSLFLCGGAVREFLRNKSIKKYKLSTNATPEQTAQILTAAEFAVEGDPEMDLSFKPKMAEQGDKKFWAVGERDTSKDRTPYSIIATVDGESFEIETFHKGPKGTNDKKVEFSDNPVVDSKGRDLTMNSLYIELSKSDGPNTKLYDPLGTGFHDIKQGVVKTNEDPMESFGQDKSRMLRAVRLHCRYGKGQLNEKIQKAIAKYKDMDGLPRSVIRDEFLQGLLHPDVDPRCFVGAYKRLGLLNGLFPGLEFDSPSGVPEEMTDQKDKALALAWLLQHNPVDKVEAALASKCDVDGEEQDSGWCEDERRAVSFLLKLKEFNPKDLPRFAKERDRAGLSKQQMEDWVDMFNVKGTQRNRRPWWAKNVRKFAKHRKTLTWDDALAAGKSELDGNPKDILDAMEIEKFQNDD